MTTSTKINFNSSENQDIKDKFVRQNVLQNVNQVVDYVSSTIQAADNDIDEDEFYSLLGSYDYETPLLDLGYVRDVDTNELIGEGLEGFTGSEEDACYELNIEPHYNESYEFYAVTDWFADKLKEKGQSVMQLLGMNVWGRGTTGQAILLDYVIGDICNDLNLLK